MNTLTTYEFRSNPDFRRIIDENPNADAITVAVDDSFLLLLKTQNDTELAHATISCSVLSGFPECVKMSNNIFRFQTGSPRDTSELQERWRAVFCTPQDVQEIMRRLADFRNNAFPLVKVSPLSA